MRHSLSKALSGSIAMATVALTATSASATATAGGNAGGGSLATQASTLPLVGNKGTGLTRGITATSINVGCIYTAADYTGYTDGIQARFARANRAGGVFGRKLNLESCDDDGNSVQTNVQDVQQLVNQSHVFSIVSLTENLLPGSSNFLDANQVPHYGWGITSNFCGARWSFGWNGCASPDTLPTSNPMQTVEQGNLASAIIAASGMKASAVRFAVQAQNSPAGINGNKGYVELFKALGAKVVYDQATFPVTATGADYTPYVQAIIAAKPNIVYISPPFADIGGFAAALKAAGYKGIAMDFVTYSPGLLASSPQLAAALQGEYINNQTVPQEESTPWTRQELADLAAIKAPKLLTLGASIGYAEAEEFIEQITATGKNLNTKTFDQTVNGGKFSNFSTIKGGPGKLLWPAAHFLPADCSVIVRVTGVKYKVVEPFKCYQSYQTKG
jgi:branched-chain amino acid transport system substrate-binding protein